MLADLFRGFLDLLAPRTCAACDLPLVDDEPAAFCGACLPLLEDAPASFAPPADVAAVFAHGGPLADAIQRFKYGGRSELAAPLAQLLVSRAASAYHGRVDVVVPVPLHPWRLRERGYDQAFLLAAPLARALAVALAGEAIVRRRATVVQASLPAAGRGANVRGAFAVGNARRVRGRAVLLVDDVRTTGATLADAARAVREAGAVSVRTLTLTLAV